MGQIYLVTEEQMKAIIITAIDEYRKQEDASFVDSSREEYLGSKQVCEELGVSPRTFQRYRDEHRIAFIQRGRKIYVKRSDLDAFLDANRIEAR